MTRLARLRDASTLTQQDGPMDRFGLLVEAGAPRGDLYELEQTTYYHVVDRCSKAVVLSFREEMEASLSTTTGMWDNYRYSGVRQVLVAPDERSVTVRYHDEREETVPLPPPPEIPAE
jgi:hypothetical protein